MSVRKMGTTPDLRTQLLNFSIAVFFAMPSVMGRVKKKKKQESQELLEKKGCHSFNQKLHLQKQ